MLLTFMALTVPVFTTMLLEDNVGRRHMSIIYNYESF